MFLTIPGENFKAHLPSFDILRILTLMISNGNESCMLASIKSVIRYQGHPLRT